MASVLVASQSPMNRDLLAFLLRTSGHDVATVAADADAFSSIADRCPELLVVDVPGDVRQVLPLVRSVRGTPRLARLPVVILAATADRESVVEAARLRTSGLLLKRNFTVEAFLKLAARAIDPTPPEPPAVRQSEPAAPPPPPPDECPPGIPDRAVALRALEPCITRKELEERLAKCEQLKAMPPTVAQILKLTSNPRVSVDQIARAIAQDHAIALRILKLANSAVYTRGEPVDSVQRAVVRIGIERIRQAVLNVAVVEEFSRNDRIQCIDVHQFWEHSIATGLIAAELAHLGGDQEPDSAFTMGLLHDVGRVIMAQQLGPMYEDVVATARRTELPLEQVESRMLLMNHADVMEQVLSTWRFAKQLAGPIVCHHQSADSIRRTAPSRLSESLRLVLADRMAHALLLGSSGNDAVYPVHELCASLRIEPGPLYALAETARTQTADMKLSMLSTGNSSAWPARRQLLRDLGPPEFRPLFASIEPGTDAYAFMLRELSDEETETPTLVVCHIRTAKETDATAAALARQEAAAGASHLPLVVLSPGGKLRPGNAGNRPLIELPTPLDPSRLLLTAAQLWQGGKIPGAV